MMTTMVDQRMGKPIVNATKIRKVIRNAQKSVDATSFPRLVIIGGLIPHFLSEGLLAGFPSFPLLRQ